jgi:hypothetical protein
MGTERGPGNGAALLNESIKGMHSWSFFWPHFWGLFLLLPGAGFFAPVGVVGADGVRGR